MNFSQWKGYAAKQDVSKITYICGEQTALVELVIADIVDILQVPSTDFISVEGTAPIWELASQYPLDPESNRLILVRDAELIEDWTGLHYWLSSSRVNPKNYVILVSNEPDAPSIFSKGKKVGYEEHIETIKTKGKFIRCSMPNDNDLVAWVESFGLTKTSAEYLVNRLSGDVESLLNVVRKTTVWEGSPSPKALGLLCDELALDSFADYIIAKDKKNAYLALEVMSEEDKLKALVHLNYKLNNLYEISTCLKKRMFDNDIASNTGIKIYIVKQLKAFAKDYDNNKIKYCRQLIAMTDSALRDGARIGVMETLITLW